MRRAPGVRPYIGDPGRNYVIRGEFHPGGECLNIRTASSRRPYGLVPVPGVTSATSIVIGRFQEW